jgi:hypothetical protein
MKWYDKQAKTQENTTAPCFIFPHGMMHSQWSDESAQMCGCLTIEQAVNNGFSQFYRP